ncbi:MAG TPA: HlyD family efflux transporter periplasmic adaptor subunit [Puia sp.]|nr:HlyD family efflux transporter periplasmic adaptor subunit [Puia sp.]
MKKRNLVILAACFSIAACHSTGENPEPVIRSIARVREVPPQFKDMAARVPLTATSVYLRRSQVNTPVAGYITKVQVKYGDAVRQGQTLYEIETKERNALGSTSLTGDTILKNFGMLVIKAPANGVITTIDRQQSGEYVMEGNPLCTITQSDDLAFQLNVPFEYRSLVRPGNRCRIVLPDQSAIEGRIVKPLSALNPQTQTQTYLVQPASNLFLPEGLVASVLLTTQFKRAAQVVPKSCVLSDELMKSFWIMRLVNDSTAVKVNVQPGIRDNTEVEILSPRLNPDDRILSEGNYGLADTAQVKLIP